MKLVHCSHFLSIILQYLLIRKTYAGGLDLNSGGLTVNDKGVNPTPKEINGSDGFTALPTLNNVLAIHETTLMPGVEPTSKVERITRAKMGNDYEDQVYQQLENEKPDYDQINEQRHKAGYAHVPFEEELIDGNCDDNDKACLDQLHMWAAAPTDPKADADEKKKKSKRDKLYENAIKVGNNRADGELKKLGGPDPYGGMLLPHLMEKEQNANKEHAKEAREKTKGAKTLKGSKKGDKAKKKSKSGEKGKKAKGKKT